MTKQKIEILAEKLVYCTTVIIPLVFVPQIVLLVQTQSSDGLSLLMLLLSALVQSIFLFKSIVIKEKAMILSMLSSLIPLTMVIGLVLYYRFFLINVS